MSFILSGGGLDKVLSLLSNKVDKVNGKGLSTNDYTNTDKGIVDGVTSALAGKVDNTSVGVANGVAELDSNGRVPSSQLPSYVDDVLEYADVAHFPATGETGKIYIAEDTNKTYRWSGSGYVEISESLGLGETSSTAYAGNKGKANADAIAGIKNGTSINSFGGVETALEGKQDELTFDSAPTASSNNPVTSNGIKTYVDNAVSQLNDEIDALLITDTFTSTPKDFTAGTDGFCSVVGINKSGYKALGIIGLDANKIGYGLTTWRINPAIPNAVAWIRPYVNLTGLEITFRILYVKN